MARSDVDIANLAITKLGARMISGFEEASKPSRLANATYAQYRDELLESHPWNFAMRRKTLSALATSELPDWGIASAYDLPSDCLRVHRVDNLTRWRVEDRRLLAEDTDSGRKNNAPSSNSYGTGTADILYIVRVEDPAQFTTQFVEAFAALLAAEWAVPLTASDAQRERFYAEYEHKLNMARSYDGQEGIPDDLQAIAWSSARQD